MAKILHTLQNNSLLDLSGNGYNGTLTAGASKGFVKTGQGMGALDFDGLNTTLPLSTFTSNADFLNGFTISAWIKPDSVGETAGRIVDKGEEDLLNGFGIFLFQSKLSCQIDSGALRQSNTINYNEWIHALITITSVGLITYYVNGNVSGTPAVSGSGNLTNDIVTANPLTIGNRSGATDRTFDGLIQNAKIWNTVLTQAEIDKEYSEFQQAKQAGNITRTVRGFEYPDSSVLRETGLLGAWNMNPVNGIVTDISNNGFNGTITGAVSAKGVRGNALQFNGTGAEPEPIKHSINLGSILGLNPSNVMTIQTRIKINSMPAGYSYILNKSQSFSVAADVVYILYLTSTSKLNLRVSDGSNIRVYTSDAVLSTGVWYDIQATWDGVSDTFVFYVNGAVFAGTKSGTAIASLQSATKFASIGGDFYASRFSFNGLIDTAKIYNIIKTPAQVSDDYKKVARLVEIQENFSDEGADGITKVPANWTAISGTWKIDQASADTGTIKKGDKYLQNVTAGIIAIPQTSAYGTWEFDLYKGADANNVVVQFISSKISAYTGASGYTFWLSSQERIDLEKNDGAGATQAILLTNQSYIANTTWYRIKITRSTAGVFTVYIKGGAFTNWTLVSVVGGSGTNPVTDTTYTTSNYFVLDLDTGDRIANIVKFQGVI